MWVESSAASNIALIKYMGKTDSADNTPCNSSLSYTLDHLRTYVHLEAKTNLTSDQWHPLVKETLRPIELSEKGRAKFLKHLQLLKNEFGITSFFDVKSANNFPSDCGLASSASSFAALTQAVHDWAVKYKNMKSKSPNELAMLSKKGSGSSCRSFYTPWVIWQNNDVYKAKYTYSHLKHQVILCDESVKSVSSSEAHKKVLTSDLFFNRPERAEKRLKQLNEILTSDYTKENWAEAFQICWSEFWDMHVLFHTSKPAFMYMNSGSQLALTTLLNEWSLNQDGPLVTMDAGSNIHLLYRADQKDVYQKMINIFSKNFSMWTDEGYIAKS